MDPIAACRDQEWVVVRKGIARGTDPVVRGTDHARRYQGLIPRVRSDRQIRRGERVRGQRGRAGPGPLGKRSDLMR